MGAFSGAYSGGHFQWVPLRFFRSPEYVLPVQVPWVANPSCDMAQTKLSGRIDRPGISALSPGLLGGGRERRARHVDRHVVFWVILVDLL